MSFILFATMHPLSAMRIRFSNSSLSMNEPDSFIDISVNLGGVPSRVQTIEAFTSDICDSLV